MSQSTAKTIRDYLRETDRMVYENGKPNRMGMALYQTTKEEIKAMPSKMRGRFLSEMRDEIARERKETLDACIEAFHATHPDGGDMARYLNVAQKALDRYLAGHTRYLKGFAY